MLRIRRTYIAVAFTLAAPLAAGAQTGALRVIRVSPTSDAPVTAMITVTFDRPVAGSLDRTIDPATILRVEPAIAGKLEWRDPVTIRLTPTTTLQPNRSYTVTVANGFRAMDGSALAEPYRFTFRVQGPLLLAGSPVGPKQGINHHITPAQKFDLVYSSPVDLAKLSAASFIEFSGTCGGQSIIRLTATTQRRIRPEDPNPLKQAGGYQRDRAADSLRRIIQLTPQTPLPKGCAGTLVAPNEVADQTTRGLAREAFETYGELRLDSLSCGDGKSCPTGPLVVKFTNPVRGSEVLRRVTLVPAAKFTIRDTTAESTTWTLDGKLQLHTGYAVIADTAIRDVFGQPLRGNPALGLRTTGYEPAINHAYGHVTVERVGFRTLAVEHVNIDTLVATIIPVPETLEAKALSQTRWSTDSMWPKLLRGATVQRIAVRNIVDRPMITGIRFPTLNAMTPHTPTMFAVRIAGRSSGKDTVATGATSLVQVTDLGVHAKIGAREGVVWVTGVSDGLAKAGAAVVVHDVNGRVVATARTDAQGIARFPRLTEPAATAPANEGDEGEGGSGADFEGYVSVTFGTDRAITSISAWDADLSPYHFNVESASSDERLPLAGAAFTERGIYKPGERVYAKTIVRNGSLGALRATSPGDSVKWLFHDREGGVLREVTTALSAFGTADQTLDLPASAAVGTYSVQIQAKRQGKWRRVAATSYRVAEYRP
ncbi:MAG: Ig-like domain-containing protein, partial [bacterium]